MKIDKIEVYGFEPTIRGMRNPLNSWDRTDSIFNGNEVVLGKNDLGLMQRLILAGTEHSKFMRYITVYMDIEAPLYWWKEFDTYKFKESNSCSTMHKITSRHLTPKDFEWDYMTDIRSLTLRHINGLIDEFNRYKEEIKEAKDESREYLVGCQKAVFREIIQDLPSAFLQKRTIVTNYAELRNMYFQRKAHKLGEWSYTFVENIKKVPYAKELIMLERGK